MFRIATLCIILAALSAPASAEMLLGDAAQGKKTYEANCLGCHDASVFTRSDRRLQSLEGLIKQVEFCNTQLKRRLSDDDRNDLVQFLNKTYYHFP